MSVTHVPVTTGGKIRRMILGGMKEMAISRSEATMQVPRNLPYASKPELPARISETTMSRAIGKKVNDVPITESRPVPRK